MQCYESNTKTSMWRESDWSVLESHIYSHTLTQMKKKTFHFHVLSQAYDIMHMLKAHFIIAYMIYMTSLQKLNATHKNHHELFISLTHGGWKRQTSPIITADSNIETMLSSLSSET